MNLEKSRMKKPYPPEHDEEAPKDGVMEYEIAVAACHDCKRVIGPTHAEDVGAELHLNHSEHETEMVSTWEESEVVEEIFFQEE